MADALLSGLDMVRFCAYYVFGWIYSVLSFIYKSILNKFTNRQSIVFISFPDISDNSLHLFLYINQHYESYDLVWLCADLKASQHKLVALGSLSERNRILLVKKNSILGLLHFAKAKVVFHTHGTYFFTRKAYQSCVVNLWHGMQIKTVGYLDNKSKYDVAYCDYTISTSTFHRTKMAQAFGLDESRVLLSGQPRNDVLLQPSKVAQTQFYSAFNVALDNEIIFWLPTYRVSNVGDIRVDSNSTSFMADFAEDFLHEINHDLAKNKQTLIIKLHPMDIENGNTCLCGAEFSNIRILNQKAWETSPIELYQALAFSSGLISDVSSVIIDYVVTQKPIAIVKQAVWDYSRGFVPGLSKIDFLNEFYNIKDIKTFKEFMFFSKVANPKQASQLFNEFEYKRISSSAYIAQVFIK
ncbi:CDP-glycerol glycerophosphotransferase family protein [Aeromonas veronii]